MYSTLPAPAVVIAHCILHRICVETQELNRQYQSVPAMYSTLLQPTKLLFQLDIVLQATIVYMGILYAVVIAHYILHRIRRSLHSSCCIEFALNQKNLSVNMKAILPCKALYLHPQWIFHIAYCTEFALKHKSLSVNIIAILSCTALYLHPTKLLFQLDIVLQVNIFYMGILYAVVIAHYMLHRIRVVTQEFIRQFHSYPAMFSTIPAPKK